MPTRLGIVAGGGKLPAQIAAMHHRRGGEVFIVALNGSTCPDTLGDLDHAWFHIGHLQSIFDRLHAGSIEQVVMIGPVSRPSLSKLDVDERMGRVLAQAGSSVAGDDGLLSAIVSEFESEGFEVVGVDAVIRGVLAPAGHFAGPYPDDDALSDIARGIDVLRSLGAVDVGQGAVIQDGLVLAVEAVEGTDAMIDRAGALKRPGPGPVLVKMAKPGQERRVDLPAIGPETIRRMVEAGFRGAAIQAGASLLIDSDDLRRKAGEADIFVVGVEPHVTGSPA